MVEKTGSSYDASSMPNGLDKELERLRSQTLITWDKEARDLRWWGLRVDMSMLEVGSGPGFVTEQLAKLVPYGKVVALEIDPVLIERARNYLQGRETGRWSIVEGDVMRMDFADDTFDFAYARYLFQHLPDPVGAAKEILRVLKPGGKLAIFDVDDNMNIFDPPGSDEVEALNRRLMKSMQEEQARKGGNRLIGRRLIHILRDAGFENRDIEAIIVHGGITDLSGVVPPPTEENTGWMVEQGIITRAELNMIIHESEIFEASDPAIVITTLVVCGEKPAASPGE